MDTEQSLVGMVTLVVQAGGESRRMGSDKALLPFLGKPLILRPLSRLAQLAREVLVICNQPEKYRFLGLTPIPDVVPRVGALGGLYTAFSAARFPYVAVIACDMPFASPALLAYQVTLLHRTGVDAVVPRTPSGAEPFHAVYRRLTCLPQVSAALEAGLRRADAWFSNVDVCFLEPEEIALYDPHRLAFVNINTPGELAYAEKLAQEKDPPDPP